MSVNTNTTKTSLDSNRDKFLDLTHQLNNYNEIYNVNSYLRKTNALELERLNRLNETLRAKVMKLKQEYLLTDFAIKEFHMRSNIMYFAVVVVALIFIIVGFYIEGKLTGTKTLVFTGLLALLYILSVIIILFSNAKRRKYAWDQYYWSSMKR